MSSEPWTDEEKRSDRRELFRECWPTTSSDARTTRRSIAVRSCRCLNGRSEGSIEFKHQNISAVLNGARRGLNPRLQACVQFPNVAGRRANGTVAGNKPRVARPFAQDSRPTTGLQEPAPIWIGPPPLPDAVEPAASAGAGGRCCTSARKFDGGRPGRAQPAPLGRAGEERVLAHEWAYRSGRRGVMTWRERFVGCPRRTGDGAGYDIASFAPDGQARLIEVKTDERVGTDALPHHPQ